MNNQETALWTWLLFRSGLPAQRAKLLLAQINKLNTPLNEVLRDLPARAKALGLQPNEVTQLKVPPEPLLPVAAVRWNEPLYPHGLQDLPLKLRPALLFYLGEPVLLQQPIVYFASTPVGCEKGNILQEIIGGLLGEGILLAALQDSPQAEILVEEMRNSAGEALLITRQGLDHAPQTPEMQAWLADGRLLLLTPLPLHAQSNPAWKNVLEQVAFAAAWRCVAGELTPKVARKTTPTALLTPIAESKYPPHIHVMEDPGEIALWLSNVPPTSATLSAPELSAELSVAPPEPPPTPSEVLRTLEAGGKVPEALRKRLLGDDQTSERG